VISLQPQYSLLSRHIEWDLLPLCEAEGLGVLPWSPLAGGWLSGRYRRDQAAPVSGSRVAWAESAKWKATNWSSMATEHTWNVIDKLVQVAEKVWLLLSAPVLLGYHAGFCCPIGGYKQNGRTPAEVALRWVMQRPGVTCPIIGAKNLEQLEDNLKTVTFTLSEEDMAALTEVSSVDVPYPWGMAWNRKGRA
jgi:aryl-alcohol dehydrogenase-like predicted oxidoreductase